MAHEDQDPTDRKGGGSVAAASVSSAGGEAAAPALIPLIERRNQASLNSFVAYLNEHGSTGAGELSTR